MKKEEIEKLSELSRITLSEDEKKDFSSEIDSVLRYVGTVGQASQSLDSSLSQDSKETARNVLREDGEPHPTGKFSDDLLEQAPDSQDGFIKVKKIL